MELRNVLGPVLALIVFAIIFIILLRLRRTSTVRGWFQKSGRVIVPASLFVAVLIFVVVSALVIRHTNERNEVSDAVLAMTQERVQVDTQIGHPPANRGLLIREVREDQYWDILPNALQDSVVIKLKIEFDPLSDEDGVTVGSTFVELGQFPASGKLPELSIRNLSSGNRLDYVKSECSTPTVDTWCYYQDHEATLPDGNSDGDSLYVCHVRISPSLGETLSTEIEIAYSVLYPKERLRSSAYYIAPCDFGSQTEIAKVSGSVSADMFSSQFTYLHATEDGNIVWKKDHPVDMEINQRLNITPCPGMTSSKQSVEFEITRPLKVPVAFTYVLVSG